MQKYNITSCSNPNFKEEFPSENIWNCKYCVETKGCNKCNLKNILDNSIVCRSFQLLT